MGVGDDGGGTVGNDGTDKLSGGHQTGFQMDVGIDKTGADDPSGHIPLRMTLVAAQTDDQTLRNRNVTGLQFAGEHIDIGGVFQYQIGLLPSGCHINDVQLFDQLAVDLAGPGFCITHKCIPPNLFFIITQLPANVKRFSLWGRERLPVNRT